MGGRVRDFGVVGDEVEGHSLVEVGKGKWLRRKI
jgi:hypothetical protein